MEQAREALKKLNVFARMPPNYRVQHSSARGKYLKRVFRSARLKGLRATTFARYCEPLVH
jgi:hypothetical protein